MNTTTANDMNISDCKVQEFQVGRTISSTKRKIRWEFKINDVPHWIELYDSKISGKKKVMVDGIVYFPSQVIRSMFSYSFYLEKSIIAIIQVGSSFECRINNFTFTILLEMQKHKKLNTENGTNSNSAAPQNSKLTNGETLKFQEEFIQENIENKENSNRSNQLFNFAFKPSDRKNTGNSSNGTQDGPTHPFSKFCTKKVENLLDSSVQNTNPRNQQFSLIDLDDGKGNRPSKINILEISPLQSPNKIHRSSTYDGFDQNIPAEGNEAENQMNSTRKWKSDKFHFNNFNSFEFSNDLSKNTTISDMHANLIKKENPDINELFFNFNPDCDKQNKEIPKIEQIKQLYKKSYSENSKTDPIMNIFGAPSFSTFSPMNISFIPQQNKNSNLNIGEQNNTQTSDKWNSFRSQFDYKNESIPKEKPTQFINKNQVENKNYSCNLHDFTTFFN